MPELLSKAVGVYLRSKRLAVGYTLELACEGLKLTTACLEKYENGKPVPLCVLYRLASKYGILEIELQNFLLAEQEKFRARNQR